MHGWLRALSLVFLLASSFETSAAASSFDHVELLKRVARVLRLHLSLEMVESYEEMSLTNIRQLHRDLGLLDLQVGISSNETRRRLELLQERPKVRQAPRIKEYTEEAVKRYLELGQASAEAFIVDLFLVKYSAPPASVAHDILPSFRRALDCSVKEFEGMECIRHLRILGTLESRDKRIDDFFRF